MGLDIPRNAEPITTRKARTKHNLRRQKDSQHGQLEQTYK